MKKSIKIVGAFDRYNYGDLLFPIVIEKYIETYRPDILRDYKIEFYGLVESDLAYVGGKTTKALKDIYDCDYEANSIIIVAGGDVIPSRIGNLDIDLSSSNMNMIFKKILRKILSIKKFEELSMKKFGINNVFPWIIDREKFKKNIFIAYNAVGSSTLDTLKDKAEISYIKKSLSKSNYISTRDSKSLNNIKDLSPKLYPDSATIMSYFFTLEYLEERIREEIKNKINKSSNGYICVQSNLFSIRG
ncbi:MAG: polysaccharide pyruvyl transferase family protein, partial [Clostridium sp.]|nr:polysaccharide pyruvyl transferase family protein [Clostridium sp.]